VVVVVSWEDINLIVLDAVIVVWLLRGWRP
jgi:hypothetical protein